MFENIRKAEENRDAGILAAYGIEKGGPVGEGSRGGHVIGHRPNGKPIYAVNSVNDAKKIMTDIEAGKDRGHMEAKIGRGSAMPNSSSGHSIDDEKDAHYVIHGNKFLDHSYEKVKQEFPAMTVEQFNTKKEEAKKRYARLLKVRDQYKLSKEKFTFEVSRRRDLPEGIKRMKESEVRALLASEKPKWERQVSMGQGHNSHDLRDKIWMLEELVRDYDANKNKI